jgi:fumarate reductase subunit D
MSIILTGFTFLFAALSLGLPFWTVNKVSVEQAFAGIDGKANFDFNAGVWGICRNIKVNAGDVNVNDGECFAYHTGSGFTGFSISGTEIAKSYDGSICDLNAEASPFFETVNYFGLGKDGLSQFLDKTCGGTGTATLTLVIVALIITVVMGLMLTLGVTCCKKNSFMNVISMWLGVIGFIVSVVAFSLWIDQANPLNGSFSWGFAFMIITAVFYALTTFSIYRHVRKAQLQNKPNHELEEHFATSAPMPAQQTQGTNLV